MEGFCGLAGLGMQVPDKVLDNDWFEKESGLDTSDKWIVRRTGIRQRRVIDQEKHDWTTSTLAEAAARKAMAEAGIGPGDLDFILLATTTADRRLPCSAFDVQALLGADGAAVCDIAAACAGFSYGLDLACSAIASRRYERLLVIGSECLSTITDYRERGTAILFGDGAGAAVVTRETPRARVLWSKVCADGASGDLIQVPAGGSRLPLTKENFDEGLQYMHLQGRDVFKFAVRSMSAMARESVAAVGKTLDDIDLFIPHQANIRILESVARELGMGMDRFFVNIQKYGNTSSASVPMALCEAVEEGRVSPGDLVLIGSFGGGLSWGAAIMRW